MEYSIPLKLLVVIRQILAFCKALDETLDEIETNSNSARTIVTYRKPEPFKGLPDLNQNKGQIIAPESAKTLLSVKQVALRLGVTPQSVYRWAREGRLSNIRLSAHAIRFRLSDIIKYEEKHKRGWS
jgi:excisionase family DNA binding protein